MSTNIQKYRIFFCGHFRKGAWKVALHSIFLSGGIFSNFLASLAGKASNNLATVMALAAEGLKEVLGEMGMTDRGIPDKSFKMLGVTAPLEAGASTKNVELHGRCHMESMPLRYKYNS
jgi:hypothetical protein